MSDSTTNQQNQTVDGSQINAAGNVTAGQIGDKYITNQAPTTPITFPHRYIGIQRNNRFVGRERELRRLHDALSKGSAVPINQSVAGLGGVGKTQLAAEYAYRHLDEYDLIYWLPAGNEQQLVDAMATLAYRLNAAKQEANQPAAAQAAKAWLANSRRRWLLIYDNADLPDMPPDTLAHYLPTTGRGALLITSRNDAWGDLRPLRLGVFTAAEAMDFWKKKVTWELGEPEVGIVTYVTLVKPQLGQILN